VKLANHSCSSEEWNCDWRSSSGQILPLGAIPDDGLCEHFSPLFAKKKILGQYFPILGQHWVLILGQYWFSNIRKSIYKANIGEILEPQYFKILFNFIQMRFVQSQIIILYFNS